jgi:hypothetical protein
MMATEIAQRWRRPSLGRVVALPLRCQSQSWSDAAPRAASGFEWHRAGPSPTTIDEEFSAEQIFRHLMNSRPSGGSDGRDVVRDAVAAS